MSILVKIFKYVDFVKKKIKNLDFGQNCRQIMILVNIFGKSRF